MRAIALMAALAASSAAPESRFFAKDVDFWGRKPKAPPAKLWEGEGAPPPGPARDLLERPTPENAKRYLEWQQMRLEKLQKALEVLEAATAEATSGSGITLFTRDECPYSRAQEEALRGLPVTVLRPGDSPALWARHKVTATPTLVVNGKVLVGLTDRSVVERLWREGRKP